MSDPLNRRGICGECEQDEHNGPCRPTQKDMVVPNHDEALRFSLGCRNSNLAACYLSLRRLVSRVLEWQPAFPVEASLLDELAAAVSDSAHEPRDALQSTGDT